MNTVIKAEKISKVYGSKTGAQTVVLKDIDMEVHQGEFVAIMGQSGSGKSTLLYSISGMDTISEGKVIFDGNDITSLSADEVSRVRLQNMGFIFQHSYLLNNLSIEDNIMLPAMKAKKKDKNKIVEQAEALMKQMEISSVAKHAIDQVSGGQLQRAAICRALMNNPKVLFADEPTGALNRSTTGEVMDLLNEIHREGTTIVLVTHDAKVAARADRIVYLADGQIEDECRLGRYEKSEKEDREQKTDEWLKKRGF
ncbi:MAG: ABC transporter ATP-binding protein [bacterium]|nr:ABC transporter ATP-binding protein [bacterium]